MKRSFVIALICMQILALSGLASAATFTDVPANHWAYAAINQLQKAGIVDGYGNNIFQGDKTMTRYEMAMIVAKAMDKADKTDIANRALIEKLSTEFAKELKDIGVRVSKLEQDKMKMSGDYRLRGKVFSDEMKSKNPFLASQDLNQKGSEWYQRVQLNISHKISDDLTSFFRLGVRQYLGDGIETGNQALDEYGFVYKNNGWQYKIGRQDVKLGSGLVLGTGFDSGWDHKFDGLTASTKMGETTFKLVAGKTTTSPVIEDSLDSTRSALLTIAGGNVAAASAIVPQMFTPTAWDVPVEWYGFDVSAKLCDGFKAGFALAHAKGDYPSSRTVTYGATTQTTAIIPMGNAPARNYWAYNFTYSLTPQWTLGGEYARSNAETLNKASMITLGCAITPKDYLWTAYLKAEANAIDEKNSNWGAFTFPTNGAMLQVETQSTEFHGMTYWYQHIMNKNTTLVLLYQDLRSRDYIGACKEGYIELNVRF